MLQYSYCVRYGMRLGDCMTLLRMDDSMGSMAWMI